MVFSIEHDGYRREKSGAKLFRETKCGANSQIEFKMRIPTSVHDKRSQCFHRLLIIILNFRPFSFFFLLFFMLIEYLGKSRLADPKNVSRL